MTLPSLPLEPQTVGVVVVNVTASPELAIALTVTEPTPTSSFASEPKVIVWGDAATVAGIWTIRPTAVDSRLNVSPPMIVVNVPLTLT